MGALDDDDALEDHVGQFMTGPNGQETSIEAAFAIVGITAPQCRLVLYHLMETPRTDQELQDLTGLPPNVETARRNDLVKKGAWVRKSGKRRLNRSGIRAIVWIITPKAYKEFGHAPERLLDDGD